MINRTILTKRLVLNGYEVLKSTNGKEGVEVVEANRTIDCVLMDIQWAALFRECYLLTNLTIVE